MGDNKYFVHYSYRPAPEPIELGSSAEGIPVYHREVLRAFEREMRGSSLYVYLTWRLDALPRVGQDVVAVVLGDEWSRTPLFAQDVRATFKVYGDVPRLGFRALGRPTWMRALLAAKYARSVIHSVPGRMRRAAARLAGPVPPIIPIPIGYGNQADLPVRPLEERTTDVFFAGSVEHGVRGRLSAAYWLRNPKTIARETMLNGLKRLQAERPDINLHTSTTQSFTLNALYYGIDDGAEALDFDAYSDAMMKAKICLVPRGTSVETFRYFEALRYGCIVIAERQPDFPFYRGAPVIEIDDWRSVGKVVTELLGDTERLSVLHEQSLAWWRDRCAPESVGRMMAEVVRQVDRGRNPGSPVAERNHASR